MTKILTISVSQTKIDTCANNFDSGKEPAHLNLHCLIFCIFFIFTDNPINNSGCVQLQRSKSSLQKFSVSLTLCCFVVYSTRRFVVLLYVFPCVILFLCFSVLLVLRLPRLGKRELILVFFVCLFGCACLDLSVSSSSWVLWVEVGGGGGGAAVCDCGTP